MNSENLNDLWVGRGVYRMTKSGAPDIREFTSYSILLELKRGDKMYPIIYTIIFEDNKFTLEGIQQGTTGRGGRGSYKYDCY